MWYRYVLWGNHVVEEQFFVHHRTPCGAWLMIPGLEDKRFVLYHSHKKFAHPDKLVALQSFHIRMQHELAYREQRVTRLKNGIELVKRMLIAGKTAQTSFAVDVDYY